MDFLIKSVLLVLGARRSPKNLVSRIVPQDGCILFTKELVLSTGYKPDENSSKQITLQKSKVIYMTY